MKLLSLFRLDGNTGNVVVNLKTAMEKDNSSQNIILRADDVITIPKQDNIVSIIGATNYDELYGSRLFGEWQDQHCFRGR